MEICAYGTNNGAPTINAKDVKIKVEAGAADYTTMNLLEC